jgi:hypothetical protein
MPARPFYRRPIFYHALTVLILVAAIYYGTTWFRGGPGFHRVPFEVPGTGVTVILPAEPIETDLSLYLVSPDRPGADDRTQVVRNFLASAGAIRGWVAGLDDYRFGVRVHYPAPPFEESVRKQIIELIDGPGPSGTLVSNLHAFDEKAVTVDGVRGRIILYDRPDGRRLAVAFFPVGPNVVFLFLEGNGAMTFDDNNLRKFIGMVTVAGK